MMNYPTRRTLLKALPFLLGVLTTTPPLEAIAEEKKEDPKDLEVFGIERTEWERRQALESYSLENFEREWRLYHSNHPTRIIITSDALREVYSGPWEIQPKIYFFTPPDPKRKSLCVVRVDGNITYQENVALPPGITVEMLDDNQFLKVTDTQGGLFVGGGQHGLERTTAPYLLLRVSEEIYPTIEMALLSRGTDGSISIPQTRTAFQYQVSFSVTIPSTDFYSRYGNPPQILGNTPDEDKDAPSWDSHYAVANEFGLEQFLDELMNEIYQTEVAKKKTTLPETRTVAWGPNRAGEYELRDQTGRTLWWNEGSIRLGRGWEFTHPYVGRTTIDGIFPEDVTVIETQSALFGGGTRRTAFQLTLGKEYSMTAKVVEDAIKK